jgi:hypothetical protein
MGLSDDGGKHMNSASILTLAAEMNAFTKFAHARTRQRRRPTWCALDDGLSLRINLCRGFPRFNQGIFDGG